MSTDLINLIHVTIFIVSVIVFAFGVRWFFSLTEQDEHGIKYRILCGIHGMSVVSMVYCLYYFMKIAATYWTL